MNVYNNFICNSQNWKCPRYPSAGPRQDKLAQPHHGRVLSKKKEQAMHRLQGVYDLSKKKAISKGHILSKSISMTFLK